MVKLQSLKSAIGRLALMGSALAMGAALSTAANATVQVGPAASVSPCTNFTFNVTILACSGGYSGNLLQDSMTDAGGLAALAALGGPTSGVYLEAKLEGLSSTAGNIDFVTNLTGMTIFGMHAGGAGDGRQGTFFFLFDAGTGVNLVHITDRLNSNATGLSNAALFQTGVTAVPEPASWAMMLMGFGAMGVAMRRGRRQQPQPQLA